MLRLSLYCQTSRGYQLPLPVGEGWGEGQFLRVLQAIMLISAEFIFMTCLELSDESYTT
jgi:hypothetical protein